MPNSSSGDLLRSIEAAELLGIDRATFNRWVAAGRIKPAVEFPGATGARLYRRAEVERVKAEAAA